MKKILTVILACTLLSGQAAAITPRKDADITISAPSAVLIEQATGEVIYEKDAHQRMPPASVTKVMTMLLIAEEIDAGRLSEEDTVTGSAHAASMGGSQIWLKEGEQMSVRDMLKSVAVSSANDCAVALAEHIAGSEEAFVQRMNSRAEELGLEDTHFTNCTGLLENADHYTSAYDIAVMSRELLKHDFIKEYTTIWMDTVRNGEFGLSNTNKLIYYYKGATGVKTGYTSEAGHCLSASAQRDGVEYIAVILKGGSSKERFEDAKTLLNYAFANYTTIDIRPQEAIAPVPVELGESRGVQPVCAGGGKLLIEKNQADQIQYTVELPESVPAPVAAGDKLGTVTATCGGEVLASVDLVAESAVARLTLPDIFAKMLRSLLGGRETE